MLEFPKTPAPKQVIVHTKEELLAKLAEAEEDIKTGRTYPAERFFENLKIKYNMY